MGGKQDLYHIWLLRNKNCLYLSITKQQYQGVTRLCQGYCSLCRGYWSRKATNPRNWMGRDIRNGTFIACKGVPNCLYILLIPYRMHTLSTIKDWGLLHQRDFCVFFARLLCSAGITNESEFHYSSSPTPRISNDITYVHTLCSVIWHLLWTPSTETNAKRWQLKTLWIRSFFWWHREHRAF